MKYPENQHFLSPKRLISLWAMLRFIMDECASVEMLSLLKTYYPKMDFINGGVATETDKAYLKNLIAKTVSICRKLDLSSTVLHLLGAFSVQLFNPGLKYEEIAIRLEPIESALKHELEGKVFVYIPHGKTQFFEQDALFGPKINEHFPSAVSDLKAAGNCMAVDLNSAAVFHLMRATEVGLHALANDLGVTAIGKKNTPINFLCWGTIIEYIDSNMSNLVSAPTDEEKKKKTAFYKGVLMRCDGIKEHWRNPISHSGKIVNDAELAVVRLHVEDFLSHLSTRIQEGK
jgi:hypothetical protein